MVVYFVDYLRILNMPYFHFLPLSLTFLFSSFNTVLSPNLHSLKYNPPFKAQPKCHHLHEKADS